MDEAFGRLAERYLDEAPALSPVWATWLGDHRFDEELDEVTPEARQRKADFCRACLDELAAIPREGLSRAGQVDAAMLEHHLRGQLWRSEQLEEWAWNPMSYSGLAGNAVYGLMAREFAPLPDRLRSAARRLEQLPRLLEQVRATLQPPRVPKVHAETAARQNRGILGLLKGMVEPHLDALAPDDRGRLQRAMEAASDAVDAHQRWLEGELLPRAAGDFRLGAERFDRKLAFTLHGPLTRAEVREKAEDAFRRVRQEMFQAARDALPARDRPAGATEQERDAAIREALEMAYRDTPPLDALVEAARDALAAVTDFVRAADVVTIPPDPVEIIVMPEFRRGTALAYCDSPGPLDVGQRTYYAIAPPPADWSDEQVRSFLREYNLRSLRNLTVHEAMPGHFLQLAHSNRYPSRLRAMLGSGVFIEGWAIYGEHVLLERGLAAGDPLTRLIVLKWLLRGVTNALLDQAVHVDGMTEARAMELMTQGAFQEEREAAGKWTRAQLTSTQLSTYFVGYAEHVALRAEVERAWGDGFDLRRYHDAVLSFGSPPTQHVRALLLGLAIA